MGNSPVLFIGHGAPTFALEPGDLGPLLEGLGARLSGAAAALVVSPHWQTAQLRVMASAAPETIHDFSGFAPELYELDYPATGHPELAAQTAQVLIEAGFEVVLDERRGLDHGAWVPLRYLFPRADVPVFQLSMPYALDPAGALRLGSALAPLRERGVVIVGSGSMTHNLGEFRGPAADNAAYVSEFRDWVRRAVLANATADLVDYRRLAPHAVRAHPSEEHFLPLLIASGAANGDAAQVVDGGICYGMLSMESYVWNS